MSKKVPLRYLPEASGTGDFVILGSKTGFALMLAASGALAIIAVIAIILFIRKFLAKEITK